MELKRRSYKLLPFHAWAPLVLVLPAVIGISVWAALPEMVPLHGVLEPGKFRILKAPVDGILELSRLDDGGIWETGDEVYRLRGKEIEDQAETARSDWQQAQEQAARLEGELSWREKAFEEANSFRREETARFKRLAAVGAVSPREVQVWKEERDRGEAETRRVLNELRYERASLAAGSKILLERKSTLEGQLALLGFRAPFRGYVIQSLDMNPAKPFLGAVSSAGHAVKAGQILGYFAQEKSLALRLSVTDESRDRLRPGLRVLWSPAGYPASRHREISGTLVGFEASPEAGITWARVEPHPESVAQFLKNTGLDIKDLWGLGVAARVEIETRPLLDRWLSP